MWRFASDAIAENIRPRCTPLRPNQTTPDCSDDDISPCFSGEEGLECPICLESFNLVENVPYVLWCGHTLCKNCVLGLQWAVMKFPNLPVQLPLFISCPWCHFLSLRLIYKGNIKFPCKNYFLLWIVENMNVGRTKMRRSFTADQQPTNSLVVGSSALHHDRIDQVTHRDHSRIDSNDESLVADSLSMERIQSSLRKSLVFFVSLTDKFPLVIIFLLIVLYAIPASAVIVALYIIVTFLFALPAFAILYFAYPSLDWLVREIFT
ncbi:uncharacterized protein [Typha angustifolia]|uniref:uncharacterized protein n=1 Tax=Typha angustifolia TaxID=59011 RepID=UPI003C2E6880